MVKRKPTEPVEIGYAIADEPAPKPQYRTMNLHTNSGTVYVATSPDGVTIAASGPLTTVHAPAILTVAEVEEVVRALDAACERLVGR